MKVQHKNLIHEKKIATNTLIQIIGKIITSGFGVISYGLLAHYFSVTQTGEYNLIVSFTGFMVVFIDFGLSTLLIRELASEKAGEIYISLIFSLRLLLSFLVLFVGLFTLTFLSFPELVKLGIVIYSIGNVLYLLASVIWAVFQAKLDYKMVVIPQVVMSFVSLHFLSFAVYFRANFLLTIAVLCLGYAAGFITSLLLYKKRIYFTFDTKKFLEILNEVWPIGFGAILSVVYFKIDSLILPYYFNPSTHPDLGYYATAYKIFEVMLVFGGFYTNTLFPFFSSQLQNKNFIQICKRFFLYTFGIAVGAMVVLYAFSKLFILVIGGAKYFPSIPSLQILSLAAFITILGGFFLTIAVSGRKQLLVLKFSIAAAILNIILNLLVIPRFSFIGASWTTVITQIFILLTNAYAAFLVLKRHPSAIIVDQV